MYGNNPIKLLNKINENNEIKIKVDPLWPEGPNNVLNSLCKVKIILFHKIWCREGINQYVVGINNSPINTLIQLILKLKILDEGSNTENKLVIIFNLMKK